MITSLQKRRNQSNETPYQNKFYLKKQHANSALINYQAISNLKDRSFNKGILNSESEENLIKKKTAFSPHRFNQQLSVIDDKFTAFTSKHEEGKQNSRFYQTNNLVGLGRSAMLKKAQQQIKQYEQRNQKNNNAPYFVQCLKRKTLITTQACMHIHTSILTFKQYLKSVQFTKAKLPDPRYAPQQQDRKTVVFDMDQTLIHTNQIMIKGFQLKVPFKSIQGKVISGYVHVRPYAKQIIKNMSKHFDVIVFTAGNQCYADPILDHLDPDRCIKHRLYRQSCTMVNCQLFVKDLRILGRKLQGVVLVDNAPYSYLMQMSNGIPILNYIKGKDDDQLVRLEDYLMSLINVQDVRTVNSETFKLKEYLDYENYERLIYSLYGKWL